MLSIRGAFSGLMDQACSLAALRGLRTAPLLTPEQAAALESSLELVLPRCQWFTVGVMAPSGDAALLALRSLEQRWGWKPLEPTPQAEVVAAGSPVFLKGNQATGLYLLRAEAGLGEGILITGHNPESPDLEDTWGPFPLSFFG